MPITFGTSAGQVVRIKPKDAADLFKISFEGADLSLPVTGIAIEQSGNYQFLHTVNNFIYVYSFGDRIGDMTISGLGFANPCGLAAEDIKLCKIFEFYDQNKLSAGKKLSVTVSDCSVSFNAFLTGMRTEMVDTQNLVGQWSLRLHVVPNK